MRERMELRKTMCRKYSQHYLLVLNLDSEYRWLMFSLEIILIMIITVCFFASIRISDGLLATRLCVVAVVSTVVTLGIFSAMAEVHADFQNMATSWKCLPMRDAWFRRYMKCVKPIGLKVGSYFVADKGLVMTIAGIIVDNTVSLLMLRAPGHVAHTK